ncbi:hypothetical protein BLD48_13280 [Exiguobacterium sp. KRL4]|uniref:hypothetical protein n=1 Tax=Exiguobacterium sp. KRL4 TaxID=1914536 RepID=UPI0008F92C90|nr:hypothetical protein [Exiguobacterium sp. KRL4]OIN65902.1 hypothetical protein BLD48_13280 [Exiguobacterium sp. KRL4]
MTPTISEVTDISLNQIFQLNPEGDIKAVYGQAYPFGTEVGLRVRNKLPNFPVRLNDYLFARRTVEPTLSTVHSHVFSRNESGVVERN